MKGKAKFEVFWPFNHVAMYFPFPILNSACAVSVFTQKKVYIHA